MTSLAQAPAKPEGTLRGAGADSPELVRWQRRLLPFMTGFVIAMSVAFFCFSAVHLYQVTTFIQTEHGQNIRVQIENELAKATAQPLSTEALTQRSLLLLEADVLDRRYHQASALLISRIWSRQLAFITGMVTTLLGAVFVLGKLSEGTSHLSGGAADWHVAIASASPGIILSFFGTVLLVASLFVRASLDIADGPAYLTVLRGISPKADSAADSSREAASDQTSSRPLSLDELQRLAPQDGRPGAKK